MIYLLTLTAFLLIPVLAQASFTPEVKAKLQQALNTVRQTQSIRGVSVAMQSADEMLMLTAGESHDGVAMSSDMLLGIGSNTKTLTSLVLLRLQMKGVLNVSQSIGAWIQPSSRIDTSITIRQLLNHTSGLGDYASTAEYRQAVLENANRVWKPDELLQFIPAPAAVKGTVWNYCNTNYLLAGLIATRATGKTLAQLYRDELFAPLNLANSFLPPEEALRGTVAHRWLGTNDLVNTPITSAWSGAWAAGAVFSTAADMAQLYTSLFSGRILDSVTLSTMLTPAFQSGYGLGIKRNIVNGTETIGHTGEIRGYTSTLVRVPRHRVSIAILTNNQPGSYNEVLQELLAVLNDATTSATDDAEDYTLRVFPNPVTSTIRIAGATGDIQIVSLTGAPVWSGAAEQAEAIDCSAWASGVYVVRSRAGTTTAIIMN
ncbi:MAG: serine hydrolase [Candidatus Kapabacteria bacterium]|nr:serine hydrolase [Candidatus Kapabacteria bacterium]